MCAQVFMSVSIVLLVLLNSPFTEILPVSMSVCRGEEFRYRSININKKILPLSYNINIYLFIVNVIYFSHSPPFHL